MFVGFAQKAVGTMEYWVSILCVVADGIANGLVNIADEATYLLVLHKGCGHLEYRVSLLYVVADGIAASSSTFVLVAPLTRPLPTTAAFFFLLALPVQLAGCTESIELTRSCSFAQREAYILLWSSWLASVTGSSPLKR